jgi:hypothetical protein
VTEKVLPFELVEAYRPGETRGAEYKQAAKRKAAGLPERLEQFDPVEDEKKAAPAIAKAIEKKTSKQYGSAPYLFVCVNLWLFDKPQMRLEDFGALAKPWSDKFHPLLTEAGNDQHNRVTEDMVP